MGTSRPVDFSHSKGSWAQMAHISQGSVTEAQMMGGDRYVQSLSAHNNVPSSLCKAASAIMTETEAHLVAGENFRSNREVPHPTPTARLTHFCPFSLTLVTGISCRNQGPFHVRN